VQLLITAARQDQITATTGSTTPPPPPTDTDDTRGVALPWNDHASRRAHALRRACRWAAHRLDPAATPRADWTWLADHADDLRMTTWAPSALADIDAAARRGWQAIDRPEDRYYAGPCGHHAAPSDPPCPVVLWATLHAATITCPRCRTRWDVAERRAWLLRSAYDVHATAQDIASLITLMTRRRLPASTVRAWRHRHPTRLPVVALDHRGRQLHRVGDVLDLIEHPPTSHPTQANPIRLALAFTAAATITRGTP